MTYLKFFILKKLSRKVSLERKIVKYVMDLIFSTEKSRLVQKTIKLCTQHRLIKSEKNIKENIIMSCKLNEKNEFKFVTYDDKEVLIMAAALRSSNL